MWRRSDRSPSLHLAGSLSCELDAAARRIEDGDESGSGRLTNREADVECIQDGGRAGRECRVGRDDLEEPLAAERRDGVVRAEVGMPSAGGGANPRALGERRDPRVEIRGAPEEMIADGRQRPGPYEATSPAATWQTARV